MKKVHNWGFPFAAVTAMLFASVTGMQGAPVSMQVVGDNDFALFVGTDSDISRLIYQNDVGWPDQLSTLLSFTFNLQAGETTFYLLGMGGGGFENVSGTLNGVDITNIAVLESSDLSGVLSDYLSNLDAVISGQYNALLPDVQAALPTVNWNAPTPTGPGDTVALQSPNGRGYHFDSDSAHLFKFTADDTAVIATPEPASTSLLLMGGLAIGLRRWMRRPSRRV